MVLASRSVQRATFATRKRNIVEKPLFLEGITRAGKFFLGKLLSGVDGIEHFQYVSVLEQVAYIVETGAFREDAAAALIRATVGERCYDRRLGRNLNLRQLDASSLHHSLDLERYLKRTKEPIGDSVVQDLLAERRSFPFLLHECLPHASFFFNAFPQARWINLQRHPVDLVYSWHKEGWGWRFGSDPRSFIPVLEGPDEPIPWFARSWVKEWTKASPMDRVVKSVTTLIEKGDQAYHRLPVAQRRRIHVARYERLVEDTPSEMQDIAAFLGRRRSPRLRRIMRNEQCPRRLPPEQREEKLAFIRGKASPPVLRELERAIGRYERGDPTRSGTNGV